ncbi:MAG TPA: hypothetical protein VGD40_25405 [Chryseosolibacter sp.]
MVRRLFIVLVFTSVIGAAHGQQANVDSLKSAVLAMRAEVDDIKVNLARSESKFKRGIFVASLGYSTVISGGLLLGRKRDDLGKALLVTGGVTGLIGTALLVDSFKYLGRPMRRKR